MAEQITLYTAKICPFAQRVELAVEEAKLPYTRYEIDLKNKPTWYAPQVNPASKVPAIAYGGTPTQPDKPSSDSVKIAESLVLLEFLADLHPALLPPTPVGRAQARFFIDAVSTKFVPAYVGAVFRGEPIEKIFEGIEAIQSLLPKAGGYALKEWSIADAAAAPFIGRLFVNLEYDLGAFEEGDGVKAFEKLQKDPKYARFRQYWDELKGRESFKKTFDKEYIKQRYEAIHIPNRESKKAAAAATVTASSARV